MEPCIHLPRVRWVQWNWLPGTDNIDNDNIVIEHGTYLGKCFTNYRSFTISYNRSLEKFSFEINAPIQFEHTEGSTRDKKRYWKKMKFLPK